MLDMMTESRVRGCQELGGLDDLPEKTEHGLMDECFKPKRLITRCNALYLSDKKVDEHRSYAINVAPRRTECKR
jgi:hypothetical protein